MIQAISTLSLIAAMFLLSSCDTKRKRFVHHDQTKLASLLRRYHIENETPAAAPSSESNQSSRDSAKIPPPTPSIAQPQPTAVNTADEESVDRNTLDPKKEKKEPKKSEREVPVVLYSILLVGLVAALGIFGWMKFRGNAASDSESVAEVSQGDQKTLRSTSTSERKAASKKSSTSSSNSKTKTAASDANEKTKARIRSKKPGLEIPESGRPGDIILEETIVPWLTENWKVADTRIASAGIDPKKWNGFFDAAIQEEISGPKAIGPAELEELAESFISKVGQDPGIAYLVGRYLDDENAAKERLLETAYLGYNKQSGKEIMAFHAAVEWALAPSPGETQQRAEVSPEAVPLALMAILSQNQLVSLDDANPAELCLESLRKALEAHNGFAELHDRVAGYILLEGVREAFFEGLHAEIHKLVAETDSVKPWLKKWVEGRHYNRYGWQVRGAGFSNTVSSENMAIYRRNMAKARKVLEEAWNENPQHPGVAADMVGHSKGQGSSLSKREMRRWLGEMLKVQLEFEEGFSGILWGLRPRWHGSTKEMLEFGEDCLNCERFDSSIPYWYLQAHRDVASEWDLPEKYFPELRNTRDLEFMFESFEAEPKREAWRQYDRTQAAVTFFKCEKGRVFRATCDSRIGPRFKLTGTISTDNVGQGARTWISFGYPEEHNERWSAVSFVFQEGVTAVLLSNAFNRPEESNEIDSGPEHKFELDVSTTGITLKVNDKTVWDDLPIPRKFVKEQHSQIGFGCLIAGERSSIQFSDVTLSRN